MGPWESQSCFAGSNFPLLSLWRTKVVCRPPEPWHLTWDGKIGSLRMLGIWKGREGWWYKVDLKPQCVTFVEESKLESRSSQVFLKSFWVFFLHITVVYHFVRFKYILETLGFAFSQLHDHKGIITWHTRWIFYVSVAWDVFQLTWKRAQRHHWKGETWKVNGQTFFLSTILSKQIAAYDNKTKNVMGFFALLKEEHNFTVAVLAVFSLWTENKTVWSWINTIKNMIYLIAVSDHLFVKKAGYTFTCSTVFLIPDLLFHYHRSKCIFCLVSFTY